MQDYLMEHFESYWSEKFKWEISRGLRGRQSFSLEKKEDGEYLSDRVREAFELWSDSYYIMHKVEGRL